jgi:hypothetical protein
MLRLKSSDFSAAGLSTNPEAKHFPGISLISIAVIVKNGEATFGGLVSDETVFQTMRHWRCSRLVNYIRFPKAGFGR